MALLAGGLTRFGGASLVVGLLLALAALVNRRRAPIPSSAEMADWLTARDVETARVARLSALLDGASLAELTERAASAARRAERLSAAAGTGSSTPDSSIDVDELRRALREAERLADLAEQQVAELSRAAMPVAEAEEGLASARADLARLESLDEVLTRTRDYLTQAQTKVYRDIAPRLASLVGRDLARVTADRYTEAFVDPGTLAVRVRGSGAPPRDADHLSIGTAEQVYLLLRVALAEHLVKAGEDSPLLLDDVTVHADHGRASRLLDVLLAVAARHQVVLFTQQAQVRDWAREQLTDARHAVRDLTALAPV
jgi:uncharacterized protein YhaN